MGSYGQFCPIAVASEVLAERWTPLWDMHRRVDADFEELVHDGQLVLAGRHDLVRAFPSCFLRSPFAEVEMSA